MTEVHLRRLDREDMLHRRAVAVISIDASAEQVAMTRNPAEACMRRLWSSWGYFAQNGQTVKRLWHMIACIRTQSAEQAWSQPKGHAAGRHSQVFLDAKG